MCCSVVTLRVITLRTGAAVQRDPALDKSPKGIAQGIKLHLVYFTIPGEVGKYFPFKALVIHKP